MSRWVTTTCPARVVWGEPVVFEAVQSDRRLRLVYRSRGATRGRERRLDPWGLVHAAGTWYLVAGREGVNRTYRVDRIAEAEILDEATDRPDTLDVREVWHELRAGWRAQPAHSIVLSVARAQGDLVRRSLGLVLLSEPEVVAGRGDRVELRAQVTSLRGAVGVLLGFGAWVEVVAPPELRDLMVEIAEESRLVHARVE